MYIFNLGIATDFASPKAKLVKLTNVLCFKMLIFLCTLCISKMQCFGCQTAEYVFLFWLQIAKFSGTPHNNG